LIQIHEQKARVISVGRRALRTLAGVGLLAIVSGVLGSVPVLAANATINGVVTDFSTGAPIAGVAVATSPASVTATTDTSGAYTLSVPAGTYDVLFTMSGYNANFVPAVSPPATANEALVPVPANAAEDLFSRPDQSGIGTASDGNTWTRDTAQFPNGTVDISSRRAFFQTVSAVTDLDVWMGIAYRDQEVTADINAISVLPPVGTQHGGRLLARVQGADTWLLMALNPSDSTLTLWVDVAGNYAQIGSVAHGFATNAWYHAKLDVIGTNVYGKAWAVGSAEPLGWQVTAPQSSITSAGVGGLRTGGADAYFMNYMETPVTQITGRVTDAGTSTAIAGATVSLNTGATTTTDSSGNYVLGGLAAGSYTVTAAAPGHNSASTTASVTLGVSAFGANLALTALPGFFSSIGGVLTTAPAAASSTATRTDVFVRGANNALYQNTFNGTAWSGFSSLGGLLTSKAAAVAGNAGRIDAFVRGSDNGVYQETWNGTSWSNWQRLGGIATTGPSSAYRAGTPGSVDVFVRGTDNGLWHRWSDDGGTTWGNWEPLGGVLTSDPGSVAWSPSGVHVVVRGTDNGVWMRSWNATTGWNSWATLGGIATSAPEVTSCSSGHLDVFVRGTDGGLWQLGFNGTSWTGWKPLGGNWTSSPSAACRPGTTTIDLFVRGTDNALWTAFVPGS
jgi:carboxypeptidase family protein